MNLNTPRESAKKLEEESGVRIITEGAENLFALIGEGEWGRAVEACRKLAFSSKSHDDVVEMLLELKYFELIDNGCIHDALICLRSELSENVVDPKR